jgi:hypothetical protein
MPFSNQFQYKVRAWGVKKLFLDLAEKNFHAQQATVEARKQFLSPF